MAGIRHTGGITIPALRQRLAALRSPEFKAELSQVLGETAGKLVNDGFRRSVDPYGKPWAPLKNRDGQPLLDTGRLRASAAVVRAPNGFRVELTAAYAKYHQFGTRPHQRRGGAIPQNAKGRFISRARAGSAKGRSQRVAIFGSFTHGGIPRRPMLPSPDLGGLPAAWKAAFDKDTVALITRKARGA